MFLLLKLVTLCDEYYNTGRKVVLSPVIDWSCGRLGFVVDGASEDGGMVQVQCMHPMMVFIACIVYYRF